MAKFLLSNEILLQRTDTAISNDEIRQSIKEGLSNAQRLKSDAILHGTLRDRFNVTNAIADAFSQISYEEATNYAYDLERLCKQKGSTELSSDFITVQRNKELKRAIDMAFLDGRYEDVYALYEELAHLKAAHQGVKKLDVLDWVSHAIFYYNELCCNPYGPVDKGRVETSPNGNYPSSKSYG